MENSNTSRYPELLVKFWEWHIKNFDEKNTSQRLQLMVEQLKGKGYKTTDRNLRKYFIQKEIPTTGLKPEALDAFARLLGRASYHDYSHAQKSPNFDNLVPKTYIIKAVEESSTTKNLLFLQSMITFSSSHEHEFWFINEEGKKERAIATTSFTRADRELEFKIDLENYFVLRGFLPMPDFNDLHKYLYGVYISHVVDLKRARLNGTPFSHGFIMELTDYEEAHKKLARKKTAEELKLEPWMVRYFTNRGKGGLPFIADDPEKDQD